ncbi:MAG: large conductance mechanosensitive channel protein MscL [Clostridiales bacterium]|nr:large conductance mechanosensitive channel protein MscL [Candidatus Equinaster intestinalis]
MKSFFEEFKKFIMRGNVLDLAVGVIIGGAFQAIVNSLVNDLIMPFVGLVTGGVNFADQFVVLKLADGVAEGTKYLSLAEATAAGATVFAYGSFVTAVINFIIMAFVIFLLVRGINRLSTVGKKKEEEVPAAPTTKVCPFCKSEISVDATRCPHCTSELDK